MTEESQEIEDIKQVEDVQETEQVQQVQDVPEAEDEQEAQDLQDDESQISDEEEPDVDLVSRASRDTETYSTQTTPTMESVVEAVLFASDESLTDARLASIVETSAKEIRRHIKNLNDKYQANNNAFRIEQIAGGYQMLTLSPYNHWLKHSYA